MIPEDKITQWANNYASLHFNKEYSPDQHWACVCSYIKGYNDCRNGANEDYKETNANKISFYEKHLKHLEESRHELPSDFYEQEKATLDELIWRLKHYQDPIQHNEIQTNNNSNSQMSKVQEDKEVH